MSTESKAWGFIALFCLTTALLSMGAVRTLSLGFFVVFVGFTLVHLGIDQVKRWEERQWEKSIHDALNQMGEE